jgi:phosphohistidine phosphatase
MDLYILRHAIAAPHGSREYPQDGDRPLTPKGIRKMNAIAEALLQLDLKFDVILSSPLARARQTAEILASVFRAKKQLAFTDHLAVGGDSGALIDEINNRYGTMESIVLVGHEPYLSEMISLLVSGDPSLSITLKKGGVCKLAVRSLSAGRCATLEWLLAPLHLTSIR